MPVTSLFSYLVQPGKHLEDQPVVAGARIPAQGRLYEMAAAMFDQATQECDIPIIFRPQDDGTQQNDCRDLLIAHQEHPTVDSGRDVARRLQVVTTHRSGLGLLFVACGSDPAPRLVLARFPADQGVVAEAHGARALTVAFIERVFMKSPTAYKCAVYRGPTAGGWWDGLAVDKQINGPRELSNYWIGEFLNSELRTTAASGTMRLAKALRKSIRETGATEVRNELLAAAQLLRGQTGRRISAERIAQDFGLSEDAATELRKHLPRPELFNEMFRFDRTEFDRHLPYRAVELDNGGVLIAENTIFDAVFQRRELGGDDARVRFTTEGKVVREHFRKRP